jgi:ElaB/YqjD/DUF883 family membrane-anchored ribosome-binding protein
MEAKAGGTQKIQKGAEQGIENYSQGAHQAVDRAAEAAASMAGRLGEHAEALGAKREELYEMGDQMMETAREYVREHPFQAVGVAVAAGYLLSMMMRSK